MWRLKQFMPKEQGGGGTLEGKTVEVGSLKLQVRSVIAQGGFSCVYLAKEAQTGRNYAVKHLRMSGVESGGAARSSSFRVGKCPSNVNQYLPQMALILLLMQSENFSGSLSHSDVGLCICTLIGVCVAVGDQKSCAHKADGCNVVSRFHNFCAFCAFFVLFFLYKM
jgi:serine/threonine protein kinase